MSVVLSSKTSTVEAPSGAVLAAVVTEKATGRRWQVLKVQSDKRDGSFYYVSVRLCSEQQSAGVVVDCTCPDRQKRGKRAGRACKHMMRVQAERKAARQAATPALPVEHDAEQADYAAWLAREKGLKPGQRLTRAAFVQEFYPEYC